MLNMYIGTALIVENEASIYELLLMILPSALVSVLAPIIIGAKVNGNS